MKNYKAIKKYLVIALTVVFAASILTVPVFAAGVMESLQNLDNQVREAAYIIIGLIGLVGAAMIFAKTRNKPATIGTLLFAVIVAAVAKNSDLLNGWGTDFVSWLSGK